MTIVTERAEIEARARVTDRMRPLRVEGRTRAPGGACPGTGATPALLRATWPTTSSRISGDPNVSIQESKAFTCDVRAGRRRGSEHRAAGRRRARRRITLGPDEDDPLAENPKEAADVSTSAPHTEIAIHQVGAPAHGLLHRHLGVHRLQGLRGRVQAMERPARRRLARPARASPMTTRASCRPARGATSASSSCSSPRPQLKDEAEQALDARRRRQAAGDPGRRRPRDLRSGRLRGPGARDVVDVADAVAQDGRLGVHVRRVQALHQRRLPGRLPDRRADPHRASDGRAAARRVQRLRLLRAGMPVRRRRPRPDRRPRRQVHALLRPPGRRTGARLREVLPDRLDPVRALRGARRARLAPGRRAA